MASQTTATSLRGRINRQNFAEIIKVHVAAIDAQIEEAHANGGDNIIFELPLSFGIENMDHKTQRILIHSEIVSLYSNPEAEGGRGMKHVQYIKNNDERKIYIRIWWFGGMSDAELEARGKLLNKHLDVIGKK